MKKKATEFKYRLLIHKKNILNEPNFYLDFEINSEKFYIHKLSSGEYCIKELIPTFKDIFTREYIARIPIDADFVVLEGKAIYIGKLSVRIPEIVRTGLGISVQVLDNKKECINELEKSHIMDLSNSDINLIHPH